MQTAIQNVSPAIAGEVRRQRTAIDRAAFDFPDFLSWSGISRSTAYREAKAGRLTLRKIGNKTVVLRDEAEQWLRNLPCAA